MGTKNNPGKFDCYENAEADEPMFVLLARDKHAPTLVWLWASLRELDQEDPAKVAEARKCTDDMIIWASKHGRKVVGIGQASLVSVMELIRTINFHVKNKGKSKTTGTDIDFMRTALSTTSFSTEQDTETEPSQALKDIAAERRRQIEAEGWTDEHDDQHGQGVLSVGAACYALEASKCKGGIFAEAAADIIDKAISDLWPWNATWWKPKDRRSDLVRAGALIIAEIERLDRAAARNTEAQP